MTTTLIERCQRCSGRMLLYREIEGDEWRCLNGHVNYGAGFQPLDVPASPQPQMGITATDREIIAVIASLGWATSVDVSRRSPQTAANCADRMRKMWAAGLLQRKTARTTTGAKYAYSVREGA